LFLIVIIEIHDFCFWQYDRPITLVLDVVLQHITSVFVVVLPENVDP